MDIKLIVAIIAFFGIASGALLQYILGGRAEKNKNVIDIRTQAYLDLISAVSEIAAGGSQRSVNQIAKLTQAKVNVVLIGSNEVVKALHQFIANFETLYSDESHKAFSAIVSAMRSDLSGKNTLDNFILKESLFGKKEKGQPGRLG